MLTSTDPRTGAATPTDIEATSAEQADAVVRAAQAAFAGVVRATIALWRAGLLDALADALDAHRAELVAVADRETGLGTGRLDGEVGRSSFQFRLFAEALRDGGYLEATIDHAGQTPLGAGPRPAPHARADRPGRGVRLEQLPVRLLGRRRRHRLGARRRQHASWSRRTAPTSRRRRGRTPCSPRRRPSTARPTASSASSSAPRPAACSSPHPLITRRRLHRVARRRPGAARHHQRPSRADPVLRRALEPQPAHRHARRRRGPRRRDRRGPVRLVHARRRPVLHQARHRLRARRRRR